MSFVEEYVNGLRDGLVESGEWQSMDKKAQNKALKEGVSRGAELAGKFSAIQQAARAHSQYLNLEAARRHMVDKVLADYRMKTILEEQLMIDELRLIVKIN